MGGGGGGGGTEAGVRRIEVGGYPIEIYLFIYLCSLFFLLYLRTAEMEKNRMVFIRALAVEL